MKQLYYAILGILLFAGGCNEDLGNYDYDYDNAPELEIDTVGMDRTPLWAAWAIGDTIRIAPNVIYPGKEQNLVYRWFILNNPYQTVTEGNAQV